VQSGAIVVRLQATLYAVGFYQKLGYVRSTGVRSGRIFDGTGFEYQPMKKTLAVRGGLDDATAGDQASLHCRKPSRDA
jgi:hypothetical protein